MNASDSIFQFSPRPEAKAMPWDQLLQPVQSAVRGLLVMLAGAESQRRYKDKCKDSDLEVASCFLVNGERGTGKTSVLLNAKEAVQNRKTFFSLNNPEKKSTDSKEQEPKAPDEREDALNCARDLSEEYHVAWLDTLDLEPIQAETNLLTTVLTRIRDALCPSCSQDKDYELTSIFEANADNARHLLGQLISDATLMWENIHEHDTRTTANRQVAAASIYASFRHRFDETMDKLTKELGRRYGHDYQCSVILPIDNIDRSTEHLHAIVKLAQLVSHPRLWLVMAGGREDIATFLERAYWKELISIGAGSGGLGRIETRGEARMKP